MGDNNSSSITLYIVIFYIITNLPGTNDGWVDQLWFSIRYGVSFDKVYISKRPEICDFMFSPFGRKGCAFEAKASIHPENKTVEISWIKVN